MPRRIVNPSATDNMRKNKRPALSSDDLLRVFLAHYGAPCKWRAKGTRDWGSTFVNAETIIHFNENEYILLLKPTYRLTATNIIMMHKLAAEHSLPDFKEDTIDTSPAAIKEYREQFEEAIELAPYAIVDYLRKEGFHVPMFGVNLFENNIAHRLLS